MELNLSKRKIKIGEIIEGTLTRIPKKYRLAAAVFFMKEDESGGGGA